MRTPPDHAALMNGLHTLMEMVRTRGSGLPALTQLLTAAGSALGADGMSLSECADRGGRVVAATGAAAWAEGLAVGGPLHPAPASWEADVDTMPEELAMQLRGRGLRRLLGTHVPHPDDRQGLLCAYFSTTQPAATPEHHATLLFVGSCAAYLYTDAARLPVADPAPAQDDQDLLLAVTSHELRTPITAIKGFADTLENHWDTLEPAARREAVRVIWQRANELAALVDRLLATAAEAGTPAAGPFDLVEALHEAVHTLPGELRQRLRVALPERLPSARGDRNAVGPVVAELVTNAARYSAGEVTLEAAADEQTVSFRVSDHGSGIAPEHVERAFTRYWQAESGDQPGSGGAGLGLHLVRRIVERQAGWVSLRPRQSGGTVAEVRLLRSDATGTDESGRPREA